MSRADVDISAKPAHAWTPVLVRNCSAGKSMDEARWHDNTDQIVYREAKIELTIGECKPIDKIPERTIIAFVGRRPAFAVARRVLQTHRA